MINCHIVEGRITKEPVLRTLPNSNNSITNATLSSKRNFKNKNNEYENDLVHITLLGKKAESFCQLCGKGDLISIVGRVQTDTSKKENGEISYFTKTVVTSWNFLSQSSYNSSSTPNNMDKKLEPNYEVNTDEQDEISNLDNMEIPDFPPDAFRDFNPNGFYNQHIMQQP